MPTSTPTRCRSTRWWRSATPRSAARPARSRWRRARTPAPGAGPGSPRRSAASTSRPDRSCAPAGTTARTGALPARPEVAVLGACSSASLVAESGLRAHLLAEDRAFLRFLDLPGDGPPLVWVHGWQCSSTGELLPAAVQPPLRHRRSLLVDLLGHGYSDKPTEFRYTLVDHARTVVDLIEALELDECGLVGHSMGGEICIRVAAA